MRHGRLWGLSGLSHRPPLLLRQRLPAPRKLSFEDELTEATKEETNSQNAYELAKKALGGSPPLRGESPRGAPGAPELRSSGAQDGAGWSGPRGVLRRGLHRAAFRGAAPQTASPLTPSWLASGVPQARDNAIAAAQLSKKETGRLGHAATFRKLHPGVYKPNYTMLVLAATQPTSDARDLLDSGITVSNKPCDT